MDIFSSNVAIVKRDAGKVVDGRVVRCILGNVRPVSVVDVYERITLLLFRLHFVASLVFAKEDTPMAWSRVTS